MKKVIGIFALLAISDRAPAVLQFCNPANCSSQISVQLTGYGPCGYSTNNWAPETSGNCASITPTTTGPCPMQSYQWSVISGSSQFNGDWLPLSTFGTDAQWQWDCLTQTMAPSQPPGAQDNNDGQKPCDDDDSCTSCAAGAPSGMPVWRVSEPYISLWIKDTPLSYQPGIGPAIFLNLAFKQRESQVGYDTNMFSFGKKWNCPWISYVTVGSYFNPVVQLPSGATDTFTNGVDYLTNARISGATNSGFTVTYSDGSADGYNFIVTNSSGQFLKALLTARTNAQGQKISLNYAAYNASAPVIRLLTVVDGDGLANTLSYSTSNPYSTNLITQVTDAYNRSASFLYDAQGRLTNITDVASISSSLIYDANDYVTNLTTPYGPTSFKLVDSPPTTVIPNGRAVEITEPDGGKQLYLFTNNALGVAANYSQIPSLSPFTGTILDNSSMDMNNSFHWNKLQYANLSSGFLSYDNVSYLDATDFLRARMKHWLRIGPKTNAVSEIISMERAASPDGSTEGQKIWYDYAGKTNSEYIGTQSDPLFIALLLPDGATTRYTRTARDSLGLSTNEVSTYSSSGGVAFRTNTFTFAANGVDLLIQTNALGVQVSSNAYNSYHQVLTNYDALGQMTVFTYNNNHLLSSVTLPTGLVTTNLYSTSAASSNRLSSTVNYAVVGGTTVYYRTNSYTWASGLIATHTDPLGLTLTNTWDNLQRLRRIDYPDNTYITNAYTNLDLVQVIDRMGYSNSFGYDSVRHLIAATNANGAVTRYGYCSCGALLYVTNAFGTPIQAVTQYSWDLQGHRILTVGPDGYTLSQNYNALGQLTNSSDGLLSLTNWFNNQGLVVASSSAYGQISATVYDILDRATNSIDANGVTITNTFDNLNRLLSRGYPDKGVESWAYTFNISGPTSYTNQLSNTVNYLYDPLGRKTIETYPGVTTNQFSYDGLGNLLTLTDGKNQVTTWHYDQFGHATNKVDATAAEIFRYSYDPNDRLTNRWTPEKFNTAYQYDAAGNLTNIAYHSSHGIALAYDMLNRLTNMVDAVGTTYYTYNGAGLLLTEDGPWPDDTVTYSYNYQRLRTGLSLLAPNASPWAQTYGYDAAERLTNVTSPAGVFGYLLGGSAAASPLPKKLVLPNGAYITNYYDSVARLLSTSLKNSANAVLNSHAYGYNLAGQRTSMTNTAGDYRSYGYDNIGQLTSALGTEAGGATRWHEQLRYTYDAAGNLNYRTNNDLVQSFTVNSLNELSNVSRITTNMTVAGTTTSIATNVTVNNLAAALYADATFARTNVGLVNGTNTFTAIASDSLGRKDTNSAICNLPSAISYSYDANGNLTNDGSRYFTYDDENQLTSVIVTNNGGVSARSDFVYDGKMRRRIRVEYTWGGSSWVTNQVVHYVYDGNLTIQERDGNNLPSVSYTRGNDLSGTIQGAGGIGGLLARTDNGILTSGASTCNAYYRADANGNITELINTNQAVVAYYIYEPSGSILSQKGPLAAANIYKFSSKESDNASGLTYYLYRYYTPESLRWLNRDPIAEAAGINLYTFEANDFNDLIDAAGLDFHYYGNWGGPGWTGGQWGDWNHIDRSKALPPIDKQDECYMHHDKCYGRCRDEKESTCNAFSDVKGSRRASLRAEMSCFEKCDRKLSTCLSNLGNDPSNNAHAKIAARYFAHSHPAPER